MSKTSIDIGFNFYLRFAKPLVLNLPEAKDRVLAAAWVQKLRSESCGSEPLRTDYLKLLLFVLQKGRLIGTFLNNPNQYETLDEFPVTTRLHEVAKCWLEAEEIQRRKRILLGVGGGDLPPFTTDCSGDLLEYVAAQDIPNFGVHVYYAISTEPLPRWDNVEAGVFPKGALGSVQKAVSAVTTATVPSETDQGDRSRIRSRSRSRSRSRRSESVGRHEEFGDKETEGIHKIRSPLGSKKPKEERLPPTWGSNLISVGDPPIPEHLFREEEGAPGPPSDVAPSSAKYPIASSPLVKGKPPPSFTVPISEVSWDTSAPSLPYKTPPWDMSAPSLPYKTPTTTPPAERFPEGVASPFFLESTPEFFDDSQLPEETPTPKRFPEGVASPFFLESTPEFFDDSQLGSPITTPSPRKFPLRAEPGIEPIYEPPSFFDEEEEAPSLPYQTPPWDMSAPSLPYQTPPWDMSAPSIPYRTPPRPPRRPLDPFAMAQAQYEDLFETTPEYVSDISSADVETTFESSGLSLPSLPPSPRLRGTPEKQDVFSIAEAQYQQLLDTPEREGPKLPRRTPTPPSKGPIKVSQSPAAQISRIIESGIAPASPAAQEIIDEVMEELSASQPAPDLEELYSEIEQKYPGRRKDMPRTPPILSKYPKIREAGKRITYKPEEFDIPGDVEWTGAPEYLEHAPPLSPRVDMREMHRPKPFKELFPTIDRKIEEEKFFDIEGDEGSVIFDDDDLLVQSPRNKLQKRLQEVMGEISKAADEVPAVAGIPVTTPRRTLSPVRSPEIDNDYPIFYEEMPSFESPTAKLSPQSRMALEAERQYKMLMSPETRREPSPEKARTPEFLRQMQLEEQAKRSPVDEFGLPLVQTLPSPIRPPLKKTKLPSPRKPEEAAPKEAAPLPEKPKEPPKPLTLEEIMAKAEQQYEELYESLVEEPVSPTKRTPTREEAEALGIPPVEKQPSPPPWSPKLSPLKKPPPPRATKPEPFTPAGPVHFEDIIDFEFPPDEIYDFFPGTPPSSPPQFAYESPVYSPREDVEFLSPPTEYKDVFDRSYSDEMEALSPPIKDILAAHEFTESFFDPDRPFMTKSVQVGTGTRRRLARYSAPPALKDIHESPEQEFPSPEPYQFPTADISKMARSPEILPTMQYYGPMTQEEQYYVSEFEDPKQQEMFRRVMRIVADVGEPLITASDIRTQVQAELPPYSPYSAEEDLVEGIGPMDFAPSPPAYATPPKLTYSAGADYLEATSPVDLEFSPSAYITPPRRTRPAAAEEAYEIPEFGFQQPYQEFVSPRISPRERRPAFSATPRSRPVPEFDFQQPYEEFVSSGVSPRQAPSRRSPPLSPEISSPRTPPGLLDTSPPFELESPPEELPEVIERLKAMPFTLPKRKPMFVRQGISGLTQVKYHEPPLFIRDIPAALTFGQEMDVIHEIPEIEYDEEHPEFVSKVKSALRLGPTGLKRRMMKEARSRKPKLYSMAEIDEYPVEYPPSPVSTRSPVGTPPRYAGPPVTYEGPSLVDVTTPRRSSPRASPEFAERTPRKTRRIKRKTTTRKLDFDTTPPSPEPPKTRPLTPPQDEEFIAGLTRQVRELERRHADLPSLPRSPLPEELMGFEGRVGAEIPQTIMDFTPPRRLPEPLQPPLQIPGWKTPPHLTAKKKTPSPFQFKLKPSLRDILYQEEPPEEFGSPAGLDLSSYEPLGTEMGEFLSPPVTPYEFEPSPPRQFGPQERQRIRTPSRRPVSSRARGIDPFAMSAAEYEALYQEPSPEREQSDAAMKVFALAQEQYAQLFDSPTEAPKLPPSPPRKMVTTSTTTITQRLPREPTVRARPRTVDTGPRTPPKDLFRRQDFDFLVLERVPEDLMPPGSPPSPISYRSALEDMRQTVRTHKYEEPPSKQAFMYGYGVKRPKPIGQRRPGLESLQEEMAEPPDAYEYWPGAYQPPPVTRPRPVERRAVSPRPMPPPRAISPPRALSPPRVVSPPKAVSPVKPRDPFGLPERYELKMEDIGIPPGFQLPTDLSPVQAPKPAKRRRKRTVKTTISEGELERIEQLVADTLVPEFEMPPLSPREQREYEELPYSPPFKYAAERVGSPLVAEEIPEDIAGYASPKTPPRIPSPGYDIFDVQEYGPGISAVTPPGEYMYESPPPSPVYTTPPPGPSEYPAYESPTTPVSPPEAFQRRIREHEYTEHARDERKAYMTKYMQIKSKRVPVSTLKARRPRLPLVFETEEPSPSPPPRTPPQVREETLVSISPYHARERQILEAVKDVEDKAAAQYAALFSPEPEEQYIENIEVLKEVQPEDFDTNIIDAPIGWRQAEVLPSALADRQLDFVSPPKTRIPSIPKRYVPDYGPLPLVDFTSPPEGYKSPPREFEEYFKDASFEGTDVLETSPVYMPPSPGTPPSPTREFEDRFQDFDFEDILETSPVYMPTSPPPRTPPTPRSPIDSPTWLRSIQEHTLVPPQGIGRVRSGSKLVKLQRKTVAPDLEVVEEMQEETTEMEPSPVYRPTQRIPSPTQEELAAYTPRRPEEFAAHISSHIPQQFLSPPPRTPTRQIPIPSTPRSQRSVQMFESPGRRPRLARRDDGIRDSPSVITETQEIIYGPEEEGSPVLQRTAGHVVRYGPPHAPPRPLSPGPWGPLDFDYDIPEPFGGQISPEILDTSDIPLETYTEEEIEDYTWIA